MIPIKPHAYAELPQDFYNLQNWQGFNNPLLVIENVQLKQELGLLLRRMEEILLSKVLKMELFIYIWEGHVQVVQVQQLR